MRAETTQLDRRPVSLQVRDLMRKSILSGQFRPGDQLPTEADFAEEYGVSRTSIREALKLLEQEGCIVVRRGRGRFASPSVTLESPASITLFHSLTDFLEGAGYEVSSLILSVVSRAPTEEEAEALDLSTRDKVVYLERFRLGNGERLVYAQSTFDQRLMPMRIEETDWSGSIITLFESRNVHFASCITDISAVNLPTAVARKHKIPTGTAWLLLRETNYDEKGRPVLFSRDYIRGDVRTYHVVQRTES